MINNKKKANNKGKHINKEKDKVNHNIKNNRVNKSDIILPYYLNFEDNSGVITDNEYEVKSEYEK